MDLLKKSLIFAVLLFILSGCSTIKNYSQLNYLPKDGAITVLPFKNNTNTPKAGEKAKNIMEGILVSKNCFVQISSYVKKHTNINTKYYLQGNINEWRYKTGLDAEPAVALNFNIIETGSGKVVFSAVGAKNGWGQESVGSVAQKLMLELMQK